MAQLPFLLLLLLVLAILLRLDFVFYLVYVLAGTYALARWWARKSLASLEVARRFTTHIFAGETTTVQLLLTNRSWLPIPWLRYDESASEGLGSAGVHEALLLRPKEKTSFTYPIEGRRRGVYAIGPGRVATGDLFGFAEVQGRSLEPGRLVVYPHVLPLSYIDLSSRAPHGTLPSRQPMFADPARAGGVREYRAGDPLRYIDWKSSARVGGLQVRKFDPAVSLPAMIFLDLNTAAYMRQTSIGVTEWAVVVAASLAAYLTEARQAVGLGSNGADSESGARCWVIPPKSGRGHLMTLLEWLARAQATETSSLASWLPSAAAALTWGTTVVAVAPSGSDEIFGALRRLRQSGLNPVLVAVEGHAQFSAVQQRAHRHGLLAYQVAGEADLRRWQARRPGAAKGFGGPG